LASLGLLSIRRPALPKPGLTQSACVTQQIKAIELITTFTAGERLAIVSDVASCLPDLHKLLNRNKASRALAAKARKLIALHSAAAIVEKANLENVLHSLSQTRLPEALTHEEFEDYFDTLEEFIYVVRPFAQQTGNHSAWAAIVASVLHQYFRLLPDTGSGETPVESPYSWNTWPQDGRVQPMTPPNTTETARNNANIVSDPPLMLWPYPGEGSDRNATMERLQAIVTYLSELNQLDPSLYRAYATSFFPSFVSTISEFFKIVNNRIFNSEHVRECLAAGRVWKSFTRTWGIAVQDTLAERLLSLANQAGASPIEVPEAAFSEAMDELLVMSSHPLLETALLLSDSDEGGLIESKFALRAKKFCKLIHHKWQLEAYQSELHQLWHLIWRCLRVLYKVKERTDILQRADEAFIEAAFFDMPLVSATFIRLLKTSDTANPRSVEDMVAKYCRQIARCRSDPDDRYDHLRSYKETKLGPHVVASVERFIKTQEAKDNLLQKLHRAVVRFNFITQGPATVRRWDVDGNAQDWTIELLDLMSPTKAVVPGPNSPTYLHPDGQTPMNHNFSNSPSTALPHPLGINVKSAFDYVYYPFPETRALEVAQSALIARDLQEPGTVSDGLRIEDLVNIPPRHVRGASNLSPIEWPNFVAPYDVVKAVRDRASAVRDGISRVFGRAPSQQPRRLERAFRGDKRPSPTFNRNRVGQRQHQFKKQGTRLRGGATSPGGTNDSLDARNGSDQSQHENQNDQAAFQQNHINEFRARTRSQSVKNDRFIVEHFLEKTLWDVAEAVRRHDAVEQVQEDSGFWGIQFWDICEHFLERSNWDVNAAAEYGRQQIDIFKRNLEDYEILNDENIIDYFLHDEGFHIRAVDALSEYRTALSARVEEFRSRIVPGDMVSDREIHRTVRRFGQMSTAVFYHLNTRRARAPCSNCHKFLGHTHHYCSCTEDSPDFLTPEARKAGLKDCHPCPYVPGEYHHRQGRQSNPPAHLQLPERCHNKLDDEFLHSALGDQRRRLVNTLYHLNDIVDPTFPRLLAHQDLDGALLGPDGFGVPQLHNREWRIHIARMLTHIAMITQEFREHFVNTIARNGGEMRVEEIEDDPPKRSSQAQAPTVELCHRVAMDLQASWEMLDYMISQYDLKFALITFRHEFGRFIRTLRELRSLYLDLLLHNGFGEEDEDGMHLAAVRNTSHKGRPGTSNSGVSVSGDGDSSEGGSGHSGSDTESLSDRADSEAEESGSPDKASVPPHYEEPVAPRLCQMIKPRRLPTYADYNRMFKDELERELIIEREIGMPVIKSYAGKKGLIGLLMRLDQRGIYGQGARNGYHALTGKAGKRPPDFRKDFEYIIAVRKRERLEKHRHTRDIRRLRRRRANLKRREQNDENERNRGEGRVAGLRPAGVGFTGIPEPEDVDSSQDSDSDILPSVSTLSAPEITPEAPVQAPSQGNNQNNAPGPAMQGQEPPAKQRRAPRQVKPWSGPRPSHRPRED